MTKVSLSSEFPRLSLEEEELLIVAEETKEIKVEIEGRNVSIILDGTTWLGEPLAIVVRSLVGWKIEQHLIRLQLFVKSMTGEEIA